MTSPETYAAFRIAPVPAPRAAHVKAVAYWARRTVGFARGEIKSRVALSPGQRCRSWRLGFSAKSYVIYELDRRDARDYLTDFAVVYRGRRLAGPPVGNKLAFARAMALNGFRHARVSAMLDLGHVHELDGQRPVCRVRDWLATGLEPGQRTVLKPMAAGEGHGIMFLDRQPAGLSVNGVAASVDDVEALLSPLRHYLITEFVVQARYAAAVYPATTNTVRILTLRDPDDGQPFIASAAHRFGSARSAPVDNWHGGWGGLSARIDLESGTLGPGATLSDAGRLVWHENHPETGAPIAGILVERWAETVATVLDLARRTPEATAVGWDLVVTDAGCCILEGNAPPGIHVWQVHGPLLANPRVRRFYEAHGVIRRVR